MIGSDSAVLILLSFLCAGMVFIICLIALKLILMDNISVKTRVDALAVDEDSDKQHKNALKNTKKQHKLELTRYKFFDNLALEIAMSGMPIKADEFLIMWIVLATVPAGLSGIISKNPIPMLAFLAIGISLPPLILKKAKKKRVCLFEKQLSDSLIVMGNCLRSGLSLNQAMESIATEMPDPIAHEFSLVLKEIKYGSNIDRALTSLSQRIKSKDLDLIVSAILISRQVGGNLSEMMDGISETIKNRLKLKDDIKVMTSTGRLSGVVIGAIPIVIALMLMLINPGYIKTFFETELGVAMLITAAFMEVTGYLIVQKIVSVKY